MRKSFRKAIALLLTAATMTGFMALGVNATATYGTKQSTAGDNSGSDVTYITGLMRYYYDTNNVNILTEVASYSEFVGAGSYMTTPGDASVYLYNEVTAKYTAYGYTKTKSAQGDEFVPAGNKRVTETKLYDKPLDLDDAYRTQYAVSGHGLYKAANGSIVYYTSNVWE